MSVLRARCPACRTVTAVAVGDGYECHACGRCFGAGLVRVPRAWGAGGETLAEAAWLGLPWPETGVVAEPALDDQNATLASTLPRLPLVLGGCCCAHVGAVRGLARRHERLALVWVDAHGDLNTSETSPSGNAWGMPLRMLLDAGDVRIEDAVLVGARSLDPPEAAFIADAGLPTGPDGLASALEHTEAVYVAFDADVLDPSGPVTSPHAVPHGLSLAEAEALLRDVAGSRLVAGVGFTGLAPDERNVAPVKRLVDALGLGVP